MKRIERRRQKSEEKAKTRARMHVDIDPDNYEYIPAEKEIDYYDNDINQIYNSEIELAIYNEMNGKDRAKYDEIVKEKLDSLELNLDI